MRLVAIGLAAGVFSAFFGVGGGIVVVPLLILFVGFSEREATATSLAAIVITAAAGVIVFSFRGEVDLGLRGTRRAACRGGRARRHRLAAAGQGEHA